MAGRTVTVEVNIDTTAFTQAMVSARDAIAGMGRFQQQYREMVQREAATFEEAATRARAVIGQTRADVDLVQIRLQGQHQKAIALGWWDTHLDDVYARLNLTRDPHIHRGES